jgi:sulfur-oxidizing protein SoxB
VTKVEGTAVWDVVSDHLRAMKHIRVDKLNAPKLINVKGYPGITGELT